MLFFLVFFHSDPDSRELSQRAPLHIAALNGYIEVTRCLIQNGANVNVQDSNYNTPLHLAAQCGHTRTVDVLLQFGNADKTILNNEKKTPFQLAMDFGHGQNKVMRQLFNTKQQDSNNNNPNYTNGNSCQNGNISDDSNGGCSILNTSFNSHTGSSISNVGNAPRTSNNSNNNNSYQNSRSNKKERRLSQLPPTPSLLPVPAMINMFKQWGIYYPIRTSYHLLCPDFGNDHERTLRHIQESFKLKTIDQIVHKLQDIENAFRTDELFHHEVLRRNQKEYIEYMNRRKHYRMEKFNKNRVMERDDEDISDYIKWRTGNHERILDLLRYFESAVENF